MPSQSTIDQITPAFSAAFQAQPGFQAFITEAASSPTMVELLNEQLDIYGPGTVGFGAAGKGASTATDGTGIISTDPSWFNGTYTAGSLVDAVAHELGHADQQNGLPNYKDINSPDAAAQASEQSEGVADQVQYQVAQELGVTMWGQGGAALQAQLQALYGSSANPNAYLNDSQYDQGVQLAAQYAAGQSPSSAPNLTYDQYFQEYFGVNKVLAGTGQTAADINWSIVQPGDINVTNIPGTGVWSVNGLAQTNSGLFTVTQGAFTGNGATSFSNSATGAPGSPAQIGTVTDGGTTYSLSGFENGTSQIMLDGASQTANIDTSSSSITEASGNVLDLNGNSNFVSVASGASLTVSSGGGEVLGGAGSVTLADGTSALFGGGGTWITNNGSALLDGGSSYIVNDEGINLGLTNGAGAIVNGDPLAAAGTISLNGNSSLWMAGSLDANINAYNSTILQTKYASIDALTGSDDNITLQNEGLSTSIDSGTGYNISGSSTGIEISTNISGTLSGTGSGLWIGGDDNTFAVSADNTVKVFQYDSGEVINISGGTIDLGNDADVTIDGSDDVLHGGSGDDISFSGQDDTVYASDSTVDFGGYSAGDVHDGSGDGGYGGQSGGGDGSYGGEGLYGGYAFASKTSATGTNVGIIASYDANLESQANAIAAETARLQAADAAASVARETPEFEGPKWTSGGVITWSLGTGPGSSGTPFTGSLSSQYEPVVEQAFATWAAASGLKFEEVSGASQADITIGWSSFDEAATGVLGYTRLSALNGQIESGTTISLENPDEDTLTAGAGGQLSYSGTDVELSQLLLHEIGHALGLADNADPNSVMSAVLSSTNTTLDKTDIAGIEELYDGLTPQSSVPAATSAIVGAGVASAASVGTTFGSAGATPSGLGSFSTQAAQLVEAMAAFSQNTSSSTVVVPPTMADALGSSLAVAVLAH